MPRTPKTDSTVREPDGDGLPLIRPDAAAIDLASEVHWVCAPNVDRTGRDVEKFGATTPALERMAEWLKERKVKSVAMESTGVPRNWNETRLPVVPSGLVRRGGLLTLINRHLSPPPGSHPPIPAGTRPFDRQEDPPSSCRP